MNGAPHVADETGQIPRLFDLDRLARGPGIKPQWLGETIEDDILAFEEIYEFLLGSSEPKSDNEILEYVIDNFPVEWSTLAQVNFRLLWLINIGKIEKADEGYIAK